jgi:HSP20 family protein
MALPQVQKDNVKITLEDGILTVSGKANEIKESDKCEVLCKEIRRSAFTRSWQLPDRADLNVCAEDIVADFYDGLLRIRVIGAYDTVGKKSKAEEIKIK